MGETNMPDCSYSDHDLQRILFDFLNLFKKMNEIFINLIDLIKFNSSRFHNPRGHLSIGVIQVLRS